MDHTKVALRISDFGMRNRKFRNPQSAIRNFSGLTVRGQAAIEFTVALVAIVILFAGTVKVWAWMVNSLVQRQVKYEETRTDAGRHAIGQTPETMVKDSAGGIDRVTGKLTYYQQQECLSIFGEDTSADCR